MSKYQTPAEKLPYVETTLTNGILVGGKRHKEVRVRMAIADDALQANKHPDSSNNYNQIFYARLVRFVGLEHDTTPEMMLGLTQKDFGKLIEAADTANGLNIEDWEQEHNP
jgi:hypothetical protein